MKLLPAIDIKDGKAVRLLKGSLDAQTDYGTPVEVAKSFVEVFQKAKLSGLDFEPWVHVVDLDAAFDSGNNRQTIEEVVQTLSSNSISVELSGGIRDDDSLNHAISIGAARVNVGTAALENPKWTRGAIKKYGDKLAIGLDVRGETLAARGWVKEGGNIWETMTTLLEDGATRFVITDVNKDGTLQGVNTTLLAHAATHIALADKVGEVFITASGGISSVADLKVVQQLETECSGTIDSVIFGKALYSGQFTLLEALQL
ncbi:1-(5-phosphoribosyl)-5-[(5-phosphoribosylamino) methylideneamino] imidazole-4-carboxamide isomerase [Actinomycetota bacterium]|nr:1-(5-phosphoribosyl)-5-[(5-phosphoribosylamino) methylideneamino] imidazole-4-carboxamide isomerase [Actinomycetota bacterium]